MAATSKNFETREVTLKISKTLGYGFSIMGGLPHDGAGAAAGPVDADRTDCSPIYISSIKPNAPSDGKVKIGAQVIEVNGFNVVGRPFTRVLTELKKRRGEVRLVTRAPKASSVYLAQVSYEKVRVLFPFHSQKDDELELIRGDVIYVMGKGTDGWAYGVCRRTALSGMFPGNFAVLMKATPEVMDSIYSELEARNPGFTHRGHAEVLYEELPSRGSGGGDSDDGAYETMAEMDGPARVDSTQEQMDALSFLLAQDDDAVGTASVGSAGVSGNSAVAGLPVARAPEVRLVGKEVISFARSPGGDDDPLYAPISGQSRETPYGSAAVGHGEIMYAHTPAQAGDTGGAGPVIESLYSTVDKDDGDDAATPYTSAQLIGRSVEDIYATLESMGKQAPQMPDRKYDKSLLPPTIRVEVAEGDGGEADDSSYELLPWQKKGHNELDVDTASGSARTSPTVAVLPASPGPALPPRQETLRHKGGLSPGTPQTKSEIKALRRQQKAQRKQLLKDQRNELKGLKKEAAVRKREKKRDRTAARTSRLFSGRFGRSKPPDTTAEPAPASTDSGQIGEENIYDETEEP